MCKPSVKDRVTQMVRNVLGPAMKAAGFHRSGRVFWRDGPEVCHLAAVMMGRWGSRDESSFDVQLGVFWHRVERILQNPSVGKMPPPEYDWTFRIDLGRTISIPPKPSWEVTHASDFDALGHEVLTDLFKYGLPWFEYRSDLRRVLEWKRYARAERRGEYSMHELVSADAMAVFKIMLGQRKSAIADLKRFVKNGHREEALRLARRLKIPVREVVSIRGQR